ncbi:hypothetical protein AgCh_030953 [Apium graveolens]
MNHVWTVPMVTAVMGFMILGRRYYRMKRKSKSVHMKVIVDDQGCDYAKQIESINFDVFVNKKGKSCYWKQNEHAKLGLMIVALQYSKHKTYEDRG